VPFADLHGVRIRYRESGVGRPGPPVLFLHGAGGSSAIWLTSLHRLARLRHAVAIDLPNHGRSTGAAASFDDLLGAVGATAATLCLGRSVLVGHSLGGLLALAAALAFPDKVAGLVLVASSARFTVSPRLMDVLTHHFSRWPELLAEMGFSPATPADVRRRGASLASQAGQEQTRTDFVLCTERDVTGQLGAIACPTLIVTGADDLLCPPKWGDVLEAGIPGARRVALPRCGHFPMLEQPDTYGALLTDTLVAML
jgi:pimeloyl-ACP methyl ester carboxylesterase